MSETEKNFESLRRLLALKRHEVPPPGYFDDFPDQVRVRLRTGSRRESFSLMDELLEQAPWLAKGLEVFEMKPAFAGVFASALCLLLLFGVVYAERPESASKPLLSAAIPAAATSLAAVSPPALAQPAEETGIVSSTNPVIRLRPLPSSSPFDQSPFGVQPVNYLLPGN
jgi:hypothetical protein